MGVKPQLRPSAQKLVGLTNAYVTQCKICGLGIFTGHKRHWSRKPLGLVHDECQEVPS